MGLRKIHGNTPRAKTVIEETAAALEKHGDLMTDMRGPIPGLPCFEPEQEYRPLKTYSPWGEVNRIKSYNIDGFRLTSRATLYQLKSPSSDAPEVQVPVVGTAVLDQSTAIISVYGVHGEELEEADPVHHIQMMRLRGKSPRKILERVRTDLAKAGIPVYPGSFLLKENAYPWREDEEFLVPRVRNDEVSAPLVGYALDPETQDIVYLHMVGHKTVLRSIWATLNSNRLRTINVTGLNDADDLRGYNRCSYKTYSSTVDQATNTYRMIVVASGALEEVEDVAYLLAEEAKEEEQEDLEKMLVARLDALLPIPVLPKWGETLKHHGIVDGLLDPCPCGGDIEEAYRIADTEGWLETIEQLLQGGELEK